LYKYPGNAWATIFIPIFMLSLLSIFIFVQGANSVEDQLGSIATLVLGFIAVIPNIKDQLPPSQKITLS
jgi:sensor histidine kinase regulating citrate/malate metabolism